MTDSAYARAAWRLSAAVVRRSRRLHERLFAPTAVEQRADAAMQQARALDLQGAVVAISGSSRGVGQALASALVAAGARVVVNGRQAGAVHDTVQRLQQEAGDAQRVRGIAVDVNTPEGAARFVAEATKGFGRIDALICNAAVAGPVGLPAWQLPADDVAPVMQANIVGPLLCARAAMAWMVAHGVPGRIVNVSSGAGRAAAPHMAPYVASKFGLEGLTQALALDAQATGIVVCAIELGTLRTQMSRAIVRYEDHGRLPPPHTVVPVFLHALTAEPAAVAGKVLAAWRYEQQPEAEAVLAKPVSAYPRFAFAPPQHRGQPLDRALPGLRCFDRAENPLGMPPAVRAMLAERHAALDFSHYPDPAYPRLRAALSERLGLPPGDITLAPGSAELVERIVRLFGGCGQDVVSNDPTWFMFDRWCAMAEVPLRRVPVRQRRPDGPYDHHLEAVADAIGPRTRLVYLINPSNPLGNTIDRAEFEAFLQRVPREVPVVVDEAYIEFSENPDALRTHELVNRTDRLLIGLRTFSKFHGLAGLRIGYGFGTPRAMRLLERLEALFCVSSLAEEAAVAALGDAGHAAATHALLRSEKARIRSTLAAAGLASLPSEAHFMLVQCPLPQDDGQAMHEALLDAGILIPRGVMHGRWMMLPVLKPEDTDRLLAVLCQAAGWRGEPLRKVG